jgi:hypothetical protein
MGGVTPPSLSETVQSLLACRCIRVGRSHSYHCFLFFLAFFFVCVFGCVDGFLGFLGTVWYILAVPETKGKTLEEITAYFKDQEAGKMAAKEGAPKPQKHRESVSTTNPLQMP